MAKNKAKNEARNNARAMAVQALDGDESSWDESVRRAAGVASRADFYSGKKEKGEFTAGEMGLPDEDEEGQKDGRGPLQQEGEGNRQNDQLAELAQNIDAKADLERRR